jgi:hypothetical protein
MLKDIKYTGLNTVSSGYDATAGQLAVAHNVINERGYIEPMTQPHELLKYTQANGLEGYRCMFRHEMLSGVVNNIFFMPDDESSDSSDSENVIGSFKYLSAKARSTEVAHSITFSEIVGAKLYEITAVGNTLCVLTSVGMDYFVWKNGTYKELGTSIPNVNIQFALKSGRISHADVALPSELVVTGSVAGMHAVPSAQQAALTETTMAAVNSAVAECTEDGKVVNPFFVRYALRLFDGTLIKHSSPILMYVSNPETVEPYVGLYKESESGGATRYSKLRVYCVYSELFFKAIAADLSDWNDIITDVEVYMTKPKSRLADGKMIENMMVLYADDATPTYLTKHKYSVHEYRDIHDYVGFYGVMNIIEYLNSYVGDTVYRNSLVLPTAEMKPELESVFYKIKNFPLSTLSSYASDFTKIDLKDVLPVLEVQATMTDDYHTHDILVPGGAYAYNERINLYGIERSVIFDQNPASFLEYFDENNDTRNVTAYVRIETPDGDKWIASDATTMIASTIGNIRYFFYPDTHAKEVRLIYNAGSILSPIWIGYTLELKQHPNLNGAYWYSEDASVFGTVTIPTVGEAIFHELNKVYTSEVGNPFYFPIGGINTVGTGKIIALASNVRAISQGQFGEFPLYVFTESGIWMLEVDDKGLYKAKQPMSLDVIEPGSQVTSVDNAVAYVIKRGLMLVSGSETRCISEALDGIAEPTPNLPQIIGGKTEQFNWNEYKKGAVCAYDNVNQRLHIYNPNYAFDWLHNEKPYHYVYSLKTGLWSTVEDDNLLLSTINGRYINTADGLLDITFEDDNHDALTQTILTRPVNFETDAYKRMRDNIQRGDLDLLRTTAGCNVKVLLQGSDDLHNWHNIGGVSKHYRIVRKSGTPHKWFRWMIVISCTPKMYRLHGLTADVEVTGNNKLR